MPYEFRKRKKPVKIAVHERYHVARGGSWDCPSEDLRSAARERQQPSGLILEPQSPKSRWWLAKQGHTGFRVACDAQTAPGTK